jgi:hypothetical protein
MYETHGTNVLSHITGCVGLTSHAQIPNLNQLSQSFGKAESYHVGVKVSRQLRADTCWTTLALKTGRREATGRPDAASIHVQTSFISISTRNFGFR